METAAIVSMKMYPVTVRLYIELYKYLNCIHCAYRCIVMYRSVWVMTFVVRQKVSCCIALHFFSLSDIVPVVPHKAVAEVSRIGNV